jgi:uncharacterized protein with ParB-like and HNH nuclease domain
MSDFITLNTIIGNGKSYSVPIYQRDYSWDKDDWEDLWNDIEEIPIDRTHYMGYIVLQSIDESSNSFWIIDGQQRLTTLSILALAITALLKKWESNDVDSENNKERRLEITKRYLGNYSLSELNIAPKLKLNRNNDDYYKSWLLNLRQPLSIAKLKPSQKLLQKAFNYFYSQLEQKFESNKSGSDLSIFLEKVIGNGIIFTQIIVNNDLDAFKVFETLNARGVKLSTADLLKNYLFKLTHQLGDLDLEEAERRWQNIANTIQSNDLTVFIRHYWNSKYKLERQPTLFKAIKREIDSPNKAFSFLNELENASIYYSAFHNPYDEIWDNEERKFLKLLSLLKVTTCFSLMLSCLQKIERSEFKLLLRELSSILFRYNLSDLNPNEAERIFSKVAIDTQNGNIKSVKEIVLALKSIYVIDESFEQAFSTLSIKTKRNKDLVKYILINIENHLSDTDYQVDDSTSTIEHILPENPGENWHISFPYEIQEDFIYRLGNYSLLEKSINNKLDNNLLFQEKHEKYSKSKYKLSNDFYLFEKFTPSELIIRQNKMAKIAKGIWRSAFLSN